MTEREHLRTVAHRLAVLRHAEEVSRNVSLTCRYYGISRACFYVWLERYREFEHELGLALTRFVVMEATRRFGVAGELQWPDGVREENTERY